MGIIYTAFLQDDFDWNYLNKDKKTTLKTIQDEFAKLDRTRPDLLGEWYGFMVLDCGKTAVWMDEYASILKRNSDTVYYCDDMDNIIRKLH